MSIESLIAALVAGLIGWVLRHHGFGKDSTLFGAGVQQTIQDAADAAAKAVADDLARPDHPVQVVVKDAVGAAVKAAVADVQKDPVAA